MNDGTLQAQLAQILVRRAHNQKKCYPKPCSEGLTPKSKSALNAMKPRWNFAGTPCPNLCFFNGSQFKPKIKVLSMQLYAAKMENTAVGNFSRTTFSYTEMLQYSMMWIRKGPVMLVTMTKTMTMTCPWKPDNTFD